ncbi:MAG: hypothetical protein ED557_13705 [Balneola sp.]|nr:MAG: hypothetical protein ED557_13705 [Balneola sp.]
MRIKSTYFFLSLFCWLVATSINSVSAQNPRLGISWSFLPNTPNQISAQLNTFENIGIEVLELTHPVSTTLLDSISNYPFEVYIRFNHNFLTATKITETRENLVQEYNTLINGYSEHTQIAAFGLYSYSQSFDENFTREFESITTELKKNTNRSFYEVTSGNTTALDFSITEITADSIIVENTALLLSKENSINDAKLLNDLFNSRTELLFINSTWFFNAIHIHPRLLLSLGEVKNGSPFILPEQKTEASSDPLNWPVIVFMLVWLSVGLHLKVSQNYRTLLFRFFTGHRFFVDDIMRYRERSMTSGIFLFLQHAFLSGITLYLVFSTLVSEKGLEAFYHFMPLLAIVGKNYFSVFIIGVLLSSLVQVIGVIWLYLPNKAMTHLSQVMNLYTWIFHLDFLIVSIMLVVYLAGGSSTLIIILSILYLLVWLTGFLLTSLDSSKYLQRGRIKYIFYTFGLHTLVNIGILVFVFANAWTMDVLQLITLL